MPIEKYTPITSTRAGKHSEIQAQLTLQPKGETGDSVVATVTPSGAGRAYIVHDIRLHCEHDAIKAIATLHPDQAAHEAMLSKNIVEFGLESIRKMEPVILFGEQLRYELENQTTYHIPLSIDLFVEETSAEIASQHREQRRVSEAA